MCRASSRTSRQQRTAVWDHIYSDGDHDLDVMLRDVKKAVETDSACRHDVRT